MAENLKLFNEHSEYTEFVQTDDFTRPNVSYCIEEDEVHYNPIIHPDYSKEYLTFIALENCTFSFYRNPIQYSLDEGNTWSTLQSEENSPTVLAGEKILWKMSGTDPGTTGIGTFSSTGRFDVSGNIMSLVNGDDFYDTSIIQSYQFYSLFYYCEYLVHAENLILPSSNIPQYGYMSMFGDCSSLISTPKLTMTTVGNYGCAAMFSRCTSLINAPEIYAVNLNDRSFWRLFNNCTSLVKGPSKLPATTLSNNCYSQMFDYCNELQFGPELPAITLNYDCYYQMFENCYKLNYIKALFLDQPVSSSVNSYTYQWVSGVASSGIFVKNINATWTEVGTYAVPSNWTVLYFDPLTDKYYLLDKTTECDDHGNVI